MDRKTIFLSWVLSLFLAWTPLLCEAFVINVDAHSEECFFERIDAGTKFSTSPLRENEMKYCNCK